MFKKWLKISGNKLNYVQGKSKPRVDCILCSIRDNDEKVESFKVYQDDIGFVVLNLYPYNLCHIMVSPLRHITTLIELQKSELIHIFRIIQGLQLLINNLYSPKGYNIGINQGLDAGASIEHLHFHIVPRYKSELGFIDIIGKTRAILEDLSTTRKKVKEKISDYLNQDFFNKFT